MPSGHVWWWKKLDYSEPVEGETQTAIRRKAGNWKKARPPVAYKCNVTFVQRRCICSATSFRRFDSFKTKKNHYVQKKKKSKTVLLHNPQ